MYLCGKVDKFVNVGDVPLSPREKFIMNPHRFCSCQRLMNAEVKRSDLLFRALVFYVSASAPALGLFKSVSGELEMGFSRG